VGKQANDHSPGVAKTLGQVANNYDVNLDTVKRWRQQGMPGKSGKYELQLISRWLRTEGPWKPYAKPPATEDELMVADGDSVALERYRLAKAKIAELDLANRKGELIDRETCRDVLVRWAVLIRRLGEVLGKRHGAEATRSVNATLGECESIIAKALAPPEDDEDGNA
jgi:phage terminase Nu1 subunit (DNA packaging protein)